MAKIKGEVSPQGWSIEVESSSEEIIYRITKNFVFVACSSYEKIHEKVRTQTGETSEENIDRPISLYPSEVAFVSKEDLDKAEQIIDREPGESYESWQARVEQYVKDFYSRQSNIEPTEEDIEDTREWLLRRHFQTQEDYEEAIRRHAKQRAIRRLKADRIPIAPEAETLSDESVQVFPQST